MTDSMSLPGPSGKGVRTKLGKSFLLDLLHALKSPYSHLGVVSELGLGVSPSRNVAYSPSRTPPQT
jgi:hypothetical protein